MRLVLLVLLGLALAACPLPQPLPEYSPGQTVTPPRIVVDDTERRVTLPQTFVKVPAGCATAPTYDLQVHLRDSNTTETIEGRWFVNYDARVQLSPTVVIQQTDEIQADPDAETPQLRQSDVFRFAPYVRTPVAGTGGGDGSAAGAVHVVEYVVSNGFDTGNGNDDTDRPNRRPHEADNQTGAFEVQLYRWVFVLVAEGDADEACP